MANTEKDRYGDTLRKKEKGQEEEYFARRERELIARLRDRDHPRGRPEASPAGPSRGQPPATSGGAGGDSRVGRELSDGGEAEAPPPRGLRRWLGRLLGGRGTD